MERRELPGAHRLETLEMRRDRIATEDAMAYLDCAWLVQSLGKKRAAAVFAKALEAGGRGGRGKARSDAVSHYDTELQRVYQAVRGKWQIRLDGSVAGVTYKLATAMRLTRIESVQSLPREIARRLCEPRWHPDLLAVFSGERPPIFTASRAATVERHVRRMAERYRRAESICRMLFPPWPPTTAAK